MAQSKGKQRVNGRGGATTTAEEEEHPSLVRPSKTTTTTMTTHHREEEVTQTLSPFLFILQNTQFIVTTLTVVLLVVLHSAHAAWFCLGTLVALGSAKTLKRFIKQPRPQGAQKYGRAYGMPSTHSSSMAYFGVYLALSSLLFPLHPTLSHLLRLPSSQHFDDDFWWLFIGRGLLALTCLVIAGLVCWSRVRLGHHTKPQVLAGATLGTLVALSWLSLWIGTDSVRFVSSSIRGTSLLPKFVRRGVRVWGHQIETLVDGFVRSNWKSFREEGGSIDVGTVKRDLHSLWRDLKRLKGEL